MADIIQLPGTKRGLMNAADKHEAMQVARQRYLRAYLDWIRTGPPAAFLDMERNALEHQLRLLQADLQEHPIVEIATDTLTPPPQHIVTVNIKIPADNDA